MVEPLLELRGITAAYGRIQVIHGVDLILPQGSVLALLGPNGAGKSTLLKVISGQLVPTGGQVFIDGTEVTGGSVDKLAKAGVCTIPEGRGIFPNLTVRKNLIMATFSGTDIDKVEEIAYHVFPRLGERRNQIAGTMSGGEKQMLAMARAIATDPALLLLDELSMGLAPIIVENLYEIVGRVAQLGVSLVIVEQFASAVLEVADFVVIMAGGRFQSIGEPVEVADELADIYLGSDGAH